MSHPADAIIWGRCARCNGGSEEDHLSRTDDSGTEWQLCQSAFDEDGDVINWDLTFDEIKAGDEIG